MDIGLVIEKLGKELTVIIRFMLQKDKDSYSLYLYSMLSYFKWNPGR